MTSAVNFASAILIESGLGFLGIGAQPPTPSWGGMVKDHFRYLLLETLSNTFTWLNNYEFGSCFYDFGE